MAQESTKGYVLETENTHMIKLALQSSGERMVFSVCGVETPGCTYGWGENINFDILI